MEPYVDYTLLRKEATAAGFKELAEEALKNTDIVQELSLPPIKIHCSVLAEDAIKAAIADYLKKNGEEKTA